MDFRPGPRRPPTPARRPWVGLALGVGAAAVMAAVFLLTGRPLR